MNRLRIQILVFLLFFSFRVTAQEDYRFFSFSEKDGLLSNVITGTAEDGNGFIWVGSFAGLMRYDGYSFTPAAAINDSSSLKGHFIAALDTDRNGDVWIATESGVSRYDIETETFTAYPSETGGKISDTYQANKVFCFADGRVRYFSGGLFELDTLKKRFVPLLENFTEEHKIRNWFYCPDGGMIAGSPSEKAFYYINSSNEAISRVSGCKTPDSNPYERPYDILSLSDGKFYAGGDNGLFLIDFNAGTAEKISEIKGVKMPRQITAFYKDKNGTVWIGSNGEELYIIPSGNQKPLKIETDNTHTSTEKLKSYTVLNFFCDSRGLMWLGTWNGLAFTELNRHGGFRNLSHPENSAILPSNSVSCFTEISEGLIAIGTDGGGIALWDGKSPSRNGWEGPSEKSKMPNYSVLALATDGKGNIYDGGYKHPLHRFSYNGKENEVYAFAPADPEALECDFICDLYYENDTALWVLTNGGGLSAFNPKTKKFRRIKTDCNGTAPCSDYGICLAMDKEKTLYAGTYNGFFRYDSRKNEIQNFYHDSHDTTALSHNWVYCVFIDSKDRIWLGTSAGLNLFDKKTGRFKVYGKESGIDGAICSGILEDSDGFLWIATGKGIAKFSPEKGKVIRIYDKNDGLLNVNFNRSACLKTKDGTMYFGSSSGAVCFKPAEIKARTYIPTPVITALKINYKKVGIKTPGSPLKKSASRTKEITLTSEQSTFTLEFASPGYLGAASYSYSYKNASTDTAWNSLNKRREIDFTKLSAGVYTIEISAQNPDGVRSGIRTFTVRVLPPWYRTTTAYIICILILSGTVFLVHYFRVRNLTHQKLRLEAEVSIRTHELNQSAEEIASQRDQLFEQNKKIQEAYNLIESKNTAIRGSITCAQTIQTALLTKETDFYKYFAPSVVFRPKDIISGDFFWQKLVNNGDTESVFVSVIDCTGHGVPGAFMSIIANSVLNATVDISQIYSPEKILSRLSNQISVMLNQNCSDNKDGMDMALCRFDRKKGGVFDSLKYAGAKNSLFIRRTNDTEYQVVKGDRHSIAGGVKYGADFTAKPFTLHEFKISPGDIIYMATDGIADMCGSDRKRFSRDRFAALLNRIYPLDMECQAAEIEKTITSYSTGAEQRDDISVLGLKILNAKI